MSVPSRQVQHEVKSGTPVAGQRRVHTASATRRTQATATAAAVETETRRRWITPARVFFAVCALVIYLGWRLPTERYITPERGFGYVLGIVGGSMMVLLLLYSARKRVRWLKFLGSAFQVVRSAHGARRPGTDLHSLSLELHPWRHATAMSRCSAC